MNGCWILKPGRELNQVCAHFAIGEERIIAISFILNTIIADVLIILFFSFHLLPIPSPLLMAFQGLALLPQTHHILKVTTIFNANFTQLLCILISTLKYPLYYDNQFLHLSSIIIIHLMVLFTK